MEGSIVPIVAKKADELSKPFSGAVAGTLAEFWNGIVGDRVVAWRLKNAAKVSEKLEKEVAERGLTLKTAALPESYAYRWFEKASEEDEPELQALFAKLLANAASGNDDALLRQNIDLVARLTPEAARLLQAFADYYLADEAAFKGGAVRGGIESTRLWHALIITPIQDMGMAVDVLLSLGVIRETDSVKMNPNVLPYNFGDDQSFLAFVRENFPSLIEVETMVWLTDLGRALIAALYPDKVGTPKAYRPPD